MTDYPDREKYFAHRYCRLLTKTCAAQEIGHIGFCLCVTIAWLEDAKRYTAPVTFYNDQLLPLLAITKWSTLARARQRCIDEKWLVYEPGGTRRVGKYWVSIPPRFADIPDGPVDEASPGLCTPKAYNGGDNRGDNRGDNGGDNGGEPSTLCPNPIPIPKEEPPPAGDGSPTRHVYTAEFEAFWSYYPRLRRKGKLDCSRKYAIAARRVGHDVLLAAVKAYAISDEGRGEYCPEPARWLAKGRYEDDPTTWQARNGHSGPVGTNGDFSQSIYNQLHPPKARTK